MFKTKGSILILSYIILGIIILSFVLFINTRKRRSEKGQELYNKWKGYNNYLQDDTHLKSYNMSSVDYWEHSIVFATTFGYADKVMEQLSVKMPMTEEIASNSKYLGLGYRHSRYRYGSFVYTMRHSYGGAYRNSVRHLPSSSGSGRSGGFSGGSFGGGGGGGRSR